MWGFSLCVFRINPCDYITTMSEDVRAIARARVTHYFMSDDVRAIARARVTHYITTMSDDVRAITRARVTHCILGCMLIVLIVLLVLLGIRVIRDKGY